MCCYDKMLVNVAAHVVRSKQERVTVYSAPHTHT